MAKKEELKLTVSGRNIVDTNILVSAVIAPHSRIANLVRSIFTSSTVLSSEATLDELRTTLGRSKFDRYIPRVARDQFLEDYARTTEPVWIAHHIIACRDPKDDKFLSLALCGRADLILTGDADLLILHPWRSTAILSPAAYLAL